MREMMLKAKGCLLFLKGFNCLENTTVENGSHVE